MALHRHIGSTVWVLSAVFGMLLRAQAPAQEGLGLKIVVLEGEDGVNIVKKKSAVKPVVEVRDKNNLPLAGVSVTFLLPGSGASGTFLHGAKSLTLITNSAGRATVSSMQPVGTGTVKIGVTASYQGQTATTTISQTNYATTASASSAGASTSTSGLSTGVIAGIVAGIAAAAAAGAIIATHGGSSTSTTTPTAPAGTISLGTGTVFGAPH
jgi:hypothetical protein